MNSAVRFSDRQFEYSLTHHTHYLFCCTQKCIMPNQEVQDANKTVGSPENDWMDFCEILCKHARSPEDESCWLGSSSDFSFSTTPTSPFSCILQVTHRVRQYFVNKILSNSMLSMFYVVVLRETSASKVLSFVLCVIYRIKFFTALHSGMCCSFLSEVLFS